MPRNRSQAGDGPFDMRRTAETLGASIAQGGPDALFDEIEKLLPEGWDDHIRAYPIAAVALAAGVGVWLGMRKSEEIVAAGSALLTAAAMANVEQFMGRTRE